MAKFDSGLESMVDTYIFETSSLLEQLDQCLMKTESENSFGEEEINEIFRIMHTIKGSSAMMGLENLSHLAHAAEDMFYIIREEKPEISDMRTLYDLVFTASDLMKAEIEVLQDESAELSDFSDHMAKIRSYAAVLGGKSDEPAKSSDGTGSGNNAEIPSGDMIEAIVCGEVEPAAVKVTFEDGCGMENLRALMVISNIKNECSALEHEPRDIENDFDTAQQIIEKGFIVRFTPSRSSFDDVASIIKETVHVKDCEMISRGGEKTEKVPASSLTTVRVTFEEDCRMENLRALLVISNIKEECSRLAFFPPDIETNQATAAAVRNDGFIIHFRSDYGDEAIIRLIGETSNVKSVEIIKTGEDIPEVNEIAEAPDSEKTAQAAAEAPEGGAQKAQNTQKEAKKQTEEKRSAPEKKSSEKGSSSKQSYISVSLYKLDQLLDMVGEMVITEAMVTSNPDLKGHRFDNFQKAARQFRKLNSELQDIVMSIRMVPISGAFNKMTRIVRDMKVKLGKDADLVFEGEDTEVDKSIIDKLNDPLMHMVRNSMDHGIEDNPQDRIALGKPARGRITLSAYSSSGEVVITIADDGAGMDPQKILDKAERSGLLTKPRSEYTDKEAYNMIMLPGFSTNEVITEYSGRGVGMDVVKKNIEKCGGTVTVDSKPGEGTSFTVRIPLSLSIVDGMEISAASSIFTIPIGYIKEAFKLRPGQLLTDTDGKEMIMIRGECYPLIRLYELYGLEGAVTDIYEGIIILAETDGKCACLLADELIGEQQVVVKPFPPLLNNFNVKQHGMAGCSILGDGSITIILDISNIISDY